MKMEMTTCAIDNLSFEENSDTKKVLNALIRAKLRRNFCFFLKGFVIGWDRNTGEVLLFLPLSDLSTLNDLARANFLSILRSNWRKEGFEIVEERELSDNVYSQVGFRSLSFRLRKEC